MYVHVHVYPSQILFWSYSHSLPCVRKIRDSHILHCVSVLTLSSQDAVTKKYKFVYVLLHANVRIHTAADNMQRTMQSEIFQTWIFFNGHDYVVSTSLIIGILCIPPFFYCVFLYLFHLQVLDTNVTVENLNEFASKLDIESEKTGNIVSTLFTLTDYVFILLVRERHYGLVSCPKLLHVSTTIICFPKY